MLTLSLRGIRSHFGRLVLTGLAIVLSVGFIGGTFILFPTVEKMLDGFISQQVSGVDVVVRRQSLADVGPTGATPLTSTMVEDISALPEVTAVQPMVFSQVSVSDVSGHTIGNTEASNWASSPFKLASVASGTPPTRANEVVIDRGTAKSKGLHVGDSLTISLPGIAPAKYSLVGLAKFGEADSAGGLQVFLSPEAIRAVPGNTDAIHWILVAGKGSQTVLRASVRSVLPPGSEAITGADYLAEQREGFAGQVLVFKSIIGGFAAVSLLVGTFLIANTFSIVVAQRTREMALLRAIGALRRQVKRMVMLEALIVGLVCSLIGLGAGVLIAKGLIALLEGSTGMPKPPALVITPIVAIAGIAVGTGTTLAAAWFPIRRGTKVEPIAALRNDDIQVVVRPSRVRLLIGALMILGGVGLVASPMGASSFLSAVAGGALLLLGGVMVSPALVTAFLRLVRPVVGRGIVGELAIDGARRSPRRTASTAAALMIGLALVTGALGVVGSMKSSLAGSFSRQYAASKVVVSGSQFGDDVVRQLASVPSVTGITAESGSVMLVDGSTTDVTAVEQLGRPTLNLGVTNGATLSSLSTDEVLVFAGTAKKLQLSVGSVLDVTFRKTGAQRLKVVGLFTNNTGFGSYVVSVDTLRKHTNNPTAYYLSIGSSLSAPETSATVSSLLAGRGASVETLAKAVKRQNQQLDSFLIFITGLLVLSMVIALLGVVNTMALSVLERTKEIGMLRAIGMTRKQVKGVIRREAFAVSAFGAALGIAIGVPVSMSLVHGLGSQGVDRFAISTGTVALVGLVAMLAGVIAALLPARRASRLDVLHAISH